MKPDMSNVVEKMKQISLKKIKETGKLIEEIPLKEYIDWIVFHCSASGIVEVILIDGDFTRTLSCKIVAKEYSVGLTDLTALIATHIMTLVKEHNMYVDVMPEVMRNLKFYPGEDWIRIKLVNCNK